MSSDDETSSNDSNNNDGNLSLNLLRLRTVVINREPHLSVGTNNLNSQIISTSVSTFSDTNSQIPISNQSEYSEENNMATLDAKYVLKLVPNFSGETRELHKFCSCASFIFKTLLEADKPAFLELLKLKLEGKAYDVIRYADIKTFADFKAILTAEFSENRSIGQIQMELANIRQSKGEDVRAYATRVEILVHDLNEACIASQGQGSAKTIQDLNAHIALQSFQEGLDQSIKVIIKACRFNKLNEAINQAIQEETILKNFSRARTPDSSSFTPKSQPKKICHLCHKVGHEIHQCYQNPKNQVKSVKSFSVLRCAYCKRMGHHIQECTLKKASDERRGTKLSTSGNASGSSRPTKDTPSKNP